MHKAGEFGIFFLKTIVGALAVQCGVPAGLAFVLTHDVPSYRYADLLLNVPCLLIPVLSIGTLAGAVVGRRERAPEPLGAGLPPPCVPWPRNRSASNAARARFFASGSWVAL